ncbi:glycosyltransferase [bacterium]|nr:glycosyltransferase [bacterium]
MVFLERSTLKQWIDTNNMNEQIELFGSATREEVKDLLCQSDCFVLSSKVETFGVVLIEAMSCGLPSFITMRTELDLFQARHTFKMLTRVSVY